MVPIPEPTFSISTSEPEDEYWAPLTRRPPLSSKLACGLVVPIPTLPLLLMCRASVLFAQSPTVFVAEELTPFVCAQAGEAASESSSNASGNGGGENPVTRFRSVILLWPDPRHVESWMTRFCQNRPPVQEKFRQGGLRPPRDDARRKRRSRGREFPTRYQDYRRIAQISSGFAITRRFASR